MQSNPPPVRIIWYHKVSETFLTGLPFHPDVFPAYVRITKRAMFQDNRLEHDVATGTLIASNALTLRVLVLAHAGEYSCEAINSVGESRSHPIFIRMKCKRSPTLSSFHLFTNIIFRGRVDAPRCRPGYERQEVTVSRDETVSLRCVVDAIPEDGIRFSWTYNGTRGDVLPMPNSRARNNGLVSVLEYAPTADADFGTLACWASNSVGRQRTPCVFSVVPGSTYSNLLHSLSCPVPFFQKDQTPLEIRKDVKTLADIRMYNTCIRMICKVGKRYDSQSGPSHRSTARSETRAPPSN